MGIKRHGSLRGAVVVESAIVTAAVLTLALGALQLGLLGFLQITVDAGAFLNAHQNAIGVTDVNGPADATHQVFPQIATSAISSAVQTAPSPTVPVDYGYNGTASEQANSSSNRHGGASMMQPYLAQTSISETPFSFLGQGFRAHSQATEANWLETDPEWDVNNTGYGSTYSAGNSQANANIFTQGENTPPYYVSFNFVKHCASGPPWGTPSQGQGNCGNSDFLSLGVAEYLDVYNWANPAAGVSGPVNSTGSGGTTGTFEAMACHQRMYATVADFLASQALLNIDPLNYLELTYNPMYYNYKAQPSNFSSGVFFQYLAATGSTTTGAAAAAQSAINTIYSWDVERQTGPSNLGTNPGDNPLHPTNGCS